ncbi:MAG: peroxiredoxin [Desulfarculus sp.]|jgi:peroxiredoxin family protein|nr:MAG: peroxiredoxin [Desulfarculus sp.]
MADKLGIFVSSDQNLGHLIGVCRAAKKAGKEVKVFLTNRGVLLTQQERFPELEGEAHVALCNVNFEAFKLQKPVPVVDEKDFATQMRHAEIIEWCDRYIVL